MARRLDSRPIDPCPDCSRTEKRRTRKQLVIPSFGRPILQLAHCGVEPPDRCETIPLRRCVGCVLEQLCEERTARALAATRTRSRGSSDESAEELVPGIGHKARSFRFLQKLEKPYPDL